MGGSTYGKHGKCVHARGRRQSVMRFRPLGSPLPHPKQFLYTCYMKMDPTFIKYIRNELTR